MNKKLIIFIVVLILGVSFIGVKKVNIQRRNRRGLTEVFSEMKYWVNIILVSFKRKIYN